MNINLTKEFDNKLFKRKEIEFELDLEKTPSKKELIEGIAKKLSADKHSIVIKKVNGKFGTKHFKINANVYHTKKDLDETEHFSKKEKEKNSKMFESKVEKVEASAETEEVEVAA